MSRGSVLNFRISVYTQLLRHWLAVFILPITVTLLVLISIGVIFYFETSLAQAAKDSLPHQAEPSPESISGIKQLVNQTKPTPRSRLAKNSSQIFSQSTDSTIPTSLSTNIEIQLPILMYHKTPADFESQLQALQAKDYTPITMRQASRILRGLEHPPAKPVVITYDDGFSDQLTAFELLKKYNMPATFYIMPGGELSQWCVGADRHNHSCGDSYLNWGEIIMLGNSGLIEIGSHTLDHAQLTKLDTEAKRHQLLSARQAIEQKTGQQVVSFAYPYGAYDTETVNLAREAGYTSAVTTLSGVNQSTSLLFELRRVRNAYDLP